MNKMNCPNCGSPINPEVHKCPYCGTSYFDMSSIDLTNHEPFYLKMKIDMNGKSAYITQLVRPSIGSMEFTTDTDYITGRNGETISAFSSGRHVTTNISFEAIPDYNKTLFNVCMEE